MSRRAVVIGAVPIAIAAAGATASLARQIAQAPQAPTAAAETVNQLNENPEPPNSPGIEASDAVVATPSVNTTPRVSDNSIPSDMALVVSPRLPLMGVGLNDPRRLLNGEVLDWTGVGSPVSIPVRPVGLVGETAGIKPIETFADYSALAAALESDPGAVALLPIELVDFRVQTLKVDGIDPLVAHGGVGRTVRIGVVGDIVPGRNVHLHMAEYGDFTRPFRRVAPLLRSFDVMIANLEGNISDTLPQPVDGHSFSFVSNSAMLEGFALAGIDAVTLANNHTVWNSEGWGLQGLLDTISALETSGVPYFGAGRDLPTARAPWVVEANGTRLAFLGIDAVTANYEVEPGVENGVVDFDAGATVDRAGTNPLLASQVNADIASATEVADVVIPYFHFGAEYVAVPPPWAVGAAHAAIDAGAAMVVTNHPHVIQGMETYNGKPIVYSPGNFIFDQMFASEVRSGYVLEIVLRDRTVIGLRYHGIEIEDFHQPRPMSAGEQAALMDRFWLATDRRIARDGAGS